MENGLYEPTSKADLDRRTLVKGAAWSVPVIAVAVGAPTASASVPAPACKPQIITDLADDKSKDKKSKDKKSKKYKEYKCTPHWYDHKGKLDEKVGKWAIVNKWEKKSSFKGHEFPVKIVDCDGKNLVGAKVTATVAGTVKKLPLLTVSLNEGKYSIFKGKSSVTGVTNSKGIVEFQLHVNAWAKLFLLSTGTLTITVVAPNGESETSVFTVRVTK